MGIAYPAPLNSPGPATRLREFDSVRLLEDLPASSVMFLDEDSTASVIAVGATGVIVEVHQGDEDLYEVEFTDPVPALATLNGSQIERR